MCLHLLLTAYHHPPNAYCLLPTDDTEATANHGGTENTKRQTWRRWAKFPPRLRHSAVIR